MNRVALCVLLASACSNSSVADSSEPSSLQADQAPAPKSEPAPTASSPPKSDPEPLQFNCQAPLVVIEEVERFLSVTGTHATESSSCVDGPGHRITLDEVLVCPKDREPQRHTFDVTYRVTRWDEGGRMVCEGKCPPVEPEHRRHRTHVVFRVDGDQLVLEPPKSVPGLPLDATPATQPHDGDCYGKSPAFEPRPIPNP